LALLRQKMTIAQSDIPDIIFIEKILLKSYPQ